MKSKILALSISLLIAALFMELSLRLVYEPPPDWHEPQIRHARSPLLGWVLPVDHEGSFTIDAPVRTNAFGLRDDDFPRKKPDGEIRVLALGDSFTFAMGVRFEDLYVQKLERKLRETHSPTEVQVINAGVAGYNTRQELLYLLAEGVDFEPDLITVGFYWNDLFKNDEPLPDLATTPMRKPGEQVTPTTDHVLPTWLRSSLRRSLLLYTGVTRLKALLGSLEEPPPDSLPAMQRALLSGDTEALAPHWQATEQRLLEIAAVGDELGVPVVLIVFPMENQLYHALPELVYEERLRAIWEPTGMPFIALLPSYQAALDGGNNPFLPYDLHPGEHGMQIAADALLEVIEREQLLAPPSETAARDG